MKYLRKYRLRIGVPEKRYVTAIDGEIVPSDATQITALQIEFDIVKGDNSSKDLNTAEITLMNVNDSTKRMIERKDSVVVLEAGWEDDSYGLIFQGDIVTYNHSKNGATWDSKIVCADGYFGVKEGITHKSFPAGVTVESVLRQLITGTEGSFVFYEAGSKEAVDTTFGPDTSAGKYSVTKPYDGLGLAIGELRGDGLKVKIENGRSIAGPTKKAIDDLCWANKLKWSIQDGKVYINDLKKDEVVKYTLPLISEETGLIASPEEVSEPISKRTNDKTASKGYKVKCTLNHEVVPEMFVKIKSEEIDSIAKVTKVKHKGSFEGDLWDTEFECTLQDVF